MDAYSPTALDKPVVVVENDPMLGIEIAEELRALGIAVRCSPSLVEGARAARSCETACLVLDCPNQENDDLLVVRRLRAEGNTTPILLVSCKAEVSDRIAGLRAGSDDYLVKPFAVGELSARVEALLRRFRGIKATRLFRSGLELDLVARSASCNGRDLELFPREFQLLEYLLRRPGDNVSREQLYRDVWRSRFASPTNVIDVCIGTLRRKLEAAGSEASILSVRKVGFRLVETNGALPQDFAATS
jgi:two-component system OmpR family response regulator